MGTPSEMVFQWIAISLIIPILATSTFIRWRANRSGDQISSKKEEGSVLLLLRSLAGLSLWLGILAYLINPGWMAWSRLPLPGWTRWAGAALMMASSPLLYWVLISLGKNITPTTAIRSEHALVSSGPYRWVRHPLYSIGFTFFMGFCLLSSNGFMILVMLGAAIILAKRTPIEEARLIERFGEEYRQYIAKTGRYFPLWGR